MILFRSFSLFLALRCRGNLHPPLLAKIKRTDLVLRITRPIGNQTGDSHHSRIGEAEDPFPIILPVSQCPLCLNLNGISSIINCGRAVVDVICVCCTCTSGFQQCPGRLQPVLHSHLTLSAPPRQVSQLYARRIHSRLSRRLH